MLRSFYSVLELDSILALECGIASFLARESADVEAEEQRNSTSTSKATAGNSPAPAGSLSLTTYLPFIVSLRIQLPLWSTLGRPSPLLPRYSRPTASEAPARSSLTTSHLSSAAILSTLPADDAAIRRYLARKAREQPAAGPSGMSFDILAYLTATPNGLKAFRIISTRLMAGTLPPMARDALAASSLFAIPKSPGQVRPIAAGEAISRTVAALLNASITPALTKNCNNTVNITTTDNNSNKSTSSQSSSRAQMPASISGWVAVKGKRSLFQNFVIGVLVAASSSLGHASTKIACSAIPCEHAYCNGRPGSWSILS